MTMGFRLNSDLFLNPEIGLNSKVAALTGRYCGHVRTRSTEQAFQNESAFKQR